VRTAAAVETRKKSTEVEPDQVFGRSGRRGPRHGGRGNASTTAGEGVDLEMNGQTYAHTNSHQSGAAVKLASAAAFVTSSFTQGCNPMAPDTRGAGSLRRLRDVGPMEIGEGGEGG